MKIETNSCCPLCKKILPATKQIEGNNVYLLKTCEEHGSFKVLISKDANRFFDKTFSSEGKAVYEHQTVKDKGCPTDCGLCPDHKQHLCSALIEITDTCNLSCPICFFDRFGENEISLDEFKNRLATIMRTENGKLDVLQISGGEPTLHSNFSEILKYAVEQNITRVLINTNGLSLLSDVEVFETIRKFRDKVEIYFQFDGFNESANIKLRGKNLLQEKLAIIEKLDNADIKICLAVTVIPENLSELNNIMDLAVKTKNITGITFQRFTKTGIGEQSEQASLVQEYILEAISDTEYLKYNHIVPLPCSHENCTSVSFVFIVDDKTYSLGDFIDYAKHQDVIKNKIGFDSTILDYVKKELSCGSRGCCSWITNNIPVVKKLKEFTEGKASTY